MINLFRFFMLLMIDAYLFFLRYVFRFLVPTWTIETFPHTPKIHINHMIILEIFIYG